MDTLLRDTPFVHNYIDDVLIASETEEGHLQHLQSVLEVLAKAKLSLNIDKCKFAQEEVNFLGFTVNRNGFGPHRRGRKQSLTFSGQPASWDSDAFWDS